jgi:hypothetical protein
MVICHFQGVSKNFGRYSSLPIFLARGYARMCSLKCLNNSRTFFKGLFLKNVHLRTNRMDFIWLVSTMLSGFAFKKMLSGHPREYVFLVSAKNLRELSFCFKNIFVRKSKILEFSKKCEGNYQKSATQKAPERIGSKSCIYTRNMYRSSV